MILTSEDFNNPLEYWKKNQPKFPRLSTVALQIFVIPATSASSERTFNSVGRVFEERRTRLNPGTIDAIMRVRSFLQDPFV